MIPTHRFKSRIKVVVWICCAITVVVSVTFIGGLGVGALIASVICVSCFLDVKASTGIDLRIIKSFAAHLFVVAVYWSARYLLEQPTTEVWKLYRFGNQKSPIGAVEAIVVLMSPTLMVLLGSALVRIRRWRVSHGEQLLPRGRPSVAQLVAFLSVILPWVWLKIQSPDKFLSVFMSGDSRNHFITTANIRMSGFASNFLGLSSLESPLFSNALAALISAGSGSTFWPSILDQFAIAGTWLLFAGITGVGVAAGIQQRCLELDDNGAALLFGSFPLLGALVFIPYSVFPMVLDGFFSLFLGSSLLFCGLVVFGGSGKRGSGFDADLLWLLAITFLLTLIYPILGPLLLIAVILSQLPTVVEFFKKRTWVLFVGASVIGLMFWVLDGQRLADRMWDQFQASASMPGSVLPRSDALLVVLLVGAIGTSLLGGAGQRRVLATVTVCFSSLGLIRVIESLDANRAAGLSYYSTKVLLAVSMCLLLLLPFQLLAIVAKHVGGHPLLRSLRLAALGALSVIAPVAMAAASAPEPTVLSSVQNGWARPRSDDALAPARFWGRDDVVFFRFVRTNDDYDISEDRILNFWSPAFWAKYDPVYARLWTWSYVELAGSDASLLCVPLEIGVKTVVTRDRSLREEVEQACKRTDFTVLVVTA